MYSVKTYIRKNRHADSIMDHRFVIFVCMMYFSAEITVINAAAEATRGAA